MTAIQRPLFRLDTELDNLIESQLWADPQYQDQTALRLREYASQLALDNPDAIAEYMAHYEGRAAAKRARAERAQLEADQLNKSADKEQLRADIACAIALEAIKNAGKHAVMGEFHTLCRQEVGGILALTVHSPGLIPDRYRTYKLDLPDQRKAEMLEALQQTDKGKALIPLLITAKSEVEKDALRTALENGAEIPGARLEQRKEKLVIK